MDDEIEHLRRQGYVTREPRGRSSQVAKLRYRVNSAQRVKVLGSDERLIEQVVLELEALQVQRRRTLALRRACQEARVLMRSTKAKMAPLVGVVGMHFHGNAIRKSRKLQTGSLPIT